MSKNVDHRDSNYRNVDLEPIFSAKKNIRSLGCPQLCGAWKHQMILVLIELEIFYKIKPTAKIRDHETGLVACDFHDFNLTKYFYETHETEAKTIYTYSL